MKTQIWINTTFLSTCHDHWIPQANCRDNCPIWLLCSHFQAAVSIIGLEDCEWLLKHDTGKLLFQPICTHPHLCLFSFFLIPLSYNMVRLEISNVMNICNSLAPNTQVPLPILTSDSDLSPTSHYAAFLALSLWHLPGLLCNIKEPMAKASNTPLMQPLSSSSLLPPLPTQPTPSCSSKCRIIGCCRSCCIAPALCGMLMSVRLPCLTHQV